MNTQRGGPIKPDRLGQVLSYPLRYYADVVIDCGQFYISA